MVPQDRLHRARSSTIDRETLFRYAFIGLLSAGLPLAAISGVRRPAAPQGPNSPLNEVPADAVPLIPAPLALETTPRPLPTPARLPDVPMTEQPWFVAVQEQLRRLGVVYVRLEKWHSDPAVYYFECRLPPAVASAASPAPTPLASLSVSAEQAAQDVLRQVQQLSPRPLPAIRTGQAELSTKLRNSR